MLAGKPKPSWQSYWQKTDTKQRRLAALLLLVFLLFPIRQSALAPAEVIALDATTVTSPLDGVVKAIHVRPNQTVKTGQALFSLDDTTLRNRLDVAQKSVAVADAELLATTQKAFDTPQSKGELSLLSGRSHEKRAELLAIQSQLSRIDVLAPNDGVAVFGNADDWLGRPVSTGERIMLLANPEKPGVLVHLPVADAISLDVGASVKLFLTVMPLLPLDAKITETSYQAVLSPEGVASYRLQAAFKNSELQPRIGLRGTAKVYGGWVCLGYYLIRRPLATLREWSGW
jgi:multidrug resistance efflux pump